ncbi:magnesium transport protein CorA [Dictyobacter alpinus]|uniref:Magnesium transport protein CorA n=1 Tax=Dictyobacter alpinus TaxID=2014873 RepID=A0A402BC97_9CHLR|nr:magnesium/cobalt transporter CorA [Dictyobacter alpinus]GCE29041.1 magnesium transport protein CorA [Dictyobacter alpinus]
MIKAIQCNIPQAQFRVLTTLDNISDQLADTEHQFWLDLSEPSAEELATVGKEFGLHPLALEDATNEHQRPKIEQYENFMFIVFYAAYFEAETQRVETRELNLFVGENYLITVHHVDIPEIHEAEQRWKRNSSHLSWGIGPLLYALLDSMVDHYFPVVDDLVERAEEMEEQIYASKNYDTERTFEMLSIKKTMLQMRRIVNPERDILNVLTNRDNPIFPEQSLAYFRDVYDHVTRLADTLDLYRDQLSSMMDASLSLSSHSLNQVMRTLTAASIILMSGSFITGIYGMNFNHDVSPFNMPELNWAFGYFFALGAIGLISLVLLVYFRRLKWI